MANCRQWNDYSTESSQNHKIWFPTFELLNRNLIHFDHLAIWVYSKVLQWLSCILFVLSENLKFCKINESQFKIVIHIFYFPFLLILFIFEHFMFINFAILFPYIDWGRKIASHIVRATNKYSGKILWTQCANFLLK